LTEILTAIVALAGPVIGIVIGHVLQERRTRERIRLRLFDDRQSALKEVYGATVDCYWSIAEAGGHVPETMDSFKQKVLDSLQRLETAIRKNGIWLSSVQDSLGKARGIFLQTSLDITYQMRPEVSGIPLQSHPPPAQTATKWEELERSFGEASRAFDRALGITAMEESYRGIIGQPRQSEESTDNRFLGRLKRWGKYVGLSLLSLLALYLSSQLTTRSDWLLIDAGFFGVALGIALAIMYTRRSWLKHYVTVVAWLGVTMGQIAGGVFQRLTLTVAPLVILDWRLISLLAVLVVTNALLLQLIDFTREFGRYRD